ncbi:type II toxin-antitoxin system PemK/MazF family toxin [Moritella viscosa]|uniref:type II toxin-antitoxin system PemK/MazF family toxin n=1 Tax=Moritella viscosa TaxID=80854 RepID=UPI00090FF83B|nr:type II toxin-antitoxin system PemK/MazF family toxin [Moritella viscosa]SGZ09897.1 Putative uncharacterized protein [Moritella viscosa]SHO17357.1 Putative uncharacterized protein [Moritella viscosa]
MAIKIIYLNRKSGDHLGYEYHVKFQEVLYPDFDPQKHTVYIRKKFLHNKITLWRVHNITIVRNTISINVTPQQSPKSLGQVAKFRNKPIGFFLKPKQYQMVDVEFGSQQDLMSPQKRVGKNTEYTSALLPGDLHKKRPCIVIDRYDDHIKVMPLTTQGSQLNSKLMKVDDEVFSGACATYSNKISYALTDMIQTVSIYRVYPMRKEDGEFNNNYNKHTLTDNNIATLKNKLIDIYAKSLSISTKEKDNYIKTLENSLIELAKFEDLKFKTMEELINEVSSLTD